MSNINIMYWNQNCYYPNHLNYHPPLNSNMMISQAGAFTVESEEDFMCGQKHRSSPNFTGAGGYTISVPGGINFEIKIDEALAFDDPALGDIQYRNGYTITLKPENKYYIADPKGATEPFDVVFTPLAAPPIPGTVPY